ncbi:MAG: TrbI/VirB10 family protein [Stellaceae bacterium]
MLGRRRPPPQVLPSPSSLAQPRAIRPSLVRLAAVGVAILLLIVGAFAYTIHERNARASARAAGANEQGAGADAVNVLRGAPRGGEIKPVTFHPAGMAPPPKARTLPARAQDTGDDGTVKYLKDAWTTYYRRLAALDEHRYRQRLKAMRDPDTRIAVNGGGTPASPAAAAPSTAAPALPSLAGFGGFGLGNLAGLGSLPGMAGAAQARPAEIDPAAAQKERWMGQDPRGGDIQITARRDPPSPYTVEAATFLPSSLVTAISSDAPGPFVAQVNRDIYNDSGSCIEIPYGSRLLGDYDAQVSMGQSRIPARLVRVIYPDGSSADLGAAAPAADQSGAAGLGGDVDRHFWERMGNGFIIGLSGVGADLAQVLPFGSSLYSGPQNAIANTTALGLSIPPTIEAPAGKRFTIVLTKDLVLRPWSCAGRRVGPRLPVMTSN